ncbi:hypothetical protein ACFWY6_20510, partial [Streptomyces sp. NPDC059037]|uniref:hypothetical protein n=1 Tax=Streptomyces sp. NPDC059037 TaxID=3346710 RepID=UPI00368AD4F0
PAATIAGLTWEGAARRRAPPGYRHPGGRAPAAAAEPPTRPAPIANAAVVRTAFFMIYLA